MIRSLMIKTFFKTSILLFLIIATTCHLYSQRLRDYGIIPGIFKTGKENAITDVEGVTVGHVTCIVADSIRTGVTAIVPHQGNIFRNKVPAAIYSGNGFGKLTGYTQVQELGNIETPIILTNTLSVAAGLDGLITYTLQQPGNENVRSVNGIVGETNDSQLNKITARYIKPHMVVEAIKNAKSGPVEEGAVGAGTGTSAFGFKGGIGTSSRVLPKSLGGYTVGVLVQTNYGGVLEIAGVPVGPLLEKYSFKNSVLQDVDGSCMIVVITDAPVDARNLERMAKRAMFGIAKTGGIASNGSGDYVIALSVCPDNLVQEEGALYTSSVLHNGDMSPLFLATIEATAEALWNSLFMARTTKGYEGKIVPQIPVDEVVKMLKQSRYFEQTLNITK
ncbi:MAG: P1 family peptidase [Bacteroidales bacterium]